MDFSNYRENLKSIVSNLFDGDIVGKKAAIVTWCNNNGPTNYGQILQCYAMQAILKGMGIEPVTILYQKLSQLATESDAKRIENFQKFINHNINVTKLCYSKEMIEEETADCDLLICGSDQIWNPVHYDPVYYLDFGMPTQKRIAVAVSGFFEKEDIYDTIYKKAAKHLKKLDYISVRERAGEEILSDYFKEKEINVFPDPTLLLTADEWNKVSVEVDLEKDYLLCYFLGNMDDFCEQIINIADSGRIQNIVYLPSNIVQIGNVSSMKRLDGMGPGELITLIKNAKIVITDSFHGKCFSDIFGVTCYCAKRTQTGKDVFGGKTRINNLKDEFGVEIKWLKVTRNSLQTKTVNKDILVSVIVPVYNASDYLEETLDDLSSQSWNNIEIICVDDGSTDDSLNILKSYQNNDKRIKVLSQKNMHAGVARNSGFSIAQGKYVIFLDADDRFNLQLIEKMVNKAEETASEIVICASEGFDGKTGEVFELAGSGLNIGIPGENESFSVCDIPENVFQLTCGWSWDKLYLRDFLIRNNLKYTDALVCEDAGMVFKSYAIADKISIVREKLICHRKFNGNSLDESRMNSWHSVFDMLFSLADYLREKNLYELVQKSFKKMAAEHIIYYLIGITNIKVMEEYVDYFRNVAIEKLKISEWEQSDYSSEAAYITINNLCDVKDVNGYMKALKAVIDDREKGLYHLQKICNDQSAVINGQHGTIEGQQQYIRKISNIKRWNFDRSILKEKPRTIVYGYGDVGRDYCNQLLADKDGELVMVVDSKYEQYKDEEIEVHPVDDIMKADYDAVLIAVFSKNTAEQISKSLQDKGVPKEKVLWFNPESACYE